MKSLQLKRRANVLQIKTRMERVTTTIEVAEVVALEVVTVEEKEVVKDHKLHTKIEDLITKRKATDKQMERN